MSHSKRKCYFPNEKKLMGFSSYSNMNCRVDCAFHLAALQCECAPWYLAGRFPTLKTCLGFQLQCFLNFMENHYVVARDECEKKCLPDCESTYFERTYLSSRTHQSCSGNDRTLAEDSEFVCQYLANKTKSAQEMAEKLGLKGFYL